MKSPCRLLRLWLFCIIMIFAFFFFDEVRGQCLEHQKSLLLKFKHSLVIDESRIRVKSLKLTNWISSTDCCLWPGVTCSGAYVTGLDLSDEGIVGGFNDSSSLYDLTGLTSLNLAMMYQETVIPSGIGRLVNLMNLNISGSYLMGKVFTVISNLTRLVSLDISYPSYSYILAENLNMHIWVGNLSNLIDLRLNGIDLSSQSREWCQALSSSAPHLQVLDLSYCGLSGSIHDSLQNLTHLSILGMIYNYFSGPIPYSVLASLKKLTSLTLSHNEFNGVFPHAMLQLPTLRYLDISGNGDLEASPSITFRNSSSLETLLLSETRIFKTIPESIGEAKMLSHLDLSYCNLSGQIPKSISQLVHLVHLDMSNNNLDGHIPSFSRSRNLTILDLSYNHLNGSILATDWIQLPQIETLTLSWNSLRGSIPACLFETPSLVRLDLQGNHFTGFTDESNITASSSHLQSLYLGDNDFQGSFPPFIYGLNSLQVLDLSFNNWSDTFHMDTGSFFAYPGSFIQLRWLELASCNLKQFPPFLTNQSRLWNLDLSDNQIDGHIPDHIWNMSALTYLNVSHNRLEFLGTEELSRGLEILDLSFNKLHGRLPNIQQGIQYLDLSRNLFDSIIPDHIWNMTTLWYLNVSHNRLEFLGTEELSGGLEILDLSSNKLHGKLPTILGGGFQYLDLSRNMFDSIIPSTIGSSAFTMGFFSLSSNKLHGSIPVSICNATSVVVLDFSNNFLSGALPECLVQLPILGVLNLRNNNISGTIPDTLPSPCVLQTLDLNYNSFQGEIPKSLGRCDSLEALDLGYNKLHDMFPCWMTNVTMLTALVLRSNSLYGNTQCLNHNYNWSRLQIMDIASNNFCGELPSRGILSWEAMLVDKNSSSDTGDLHYSMPYATLISKGKNNLVNLYFRNVVSVIAKGQQMNWTKISTIYTLVDFSDNKIEGDIPHELGELKFLYILNLSHNFLSGRIPPSFGKLYHIESLDLSNNELSGKIPGQLASLNFLSTLNLSFNHLDGMIPYGRQFQTFTEASFKGNKGLCGQQLNTSCGNVGVSSPPNPSSESEDHKFRDIFIAIGIGYAVGLGLVIMPLIFWSRWREEYYECIDKVLMNIFYCQPKKSPASRTIKRRN